MHGMGATASPRLSPLAAARVGQPAAAAQQGDTAGPLRSRMGVPTTPSRQAQVQRLLHQCLQATASQRVFLFSHVLREFTWLHICGLNRVSILPM